ncbi:hypothetical protein [Permianibacter aggregans]|uniref:Uncharacterized protein n=1 Tax=Permianibacter aggregans TaxID=1510150 RepID=A0A4R6UV80_9GAMM|nr:hypothetical protein [Permianibacter aggregans]QGX41449.1 hypothetical protein E2H98_17955 [Permianibacter aggregans]TDQ51240.1 hypothetical protein EV696_101213 [Permianibacter aggregans]
MKSINQQLLTILQQSAFKDADPEQCPRLIQQWRQQNAVSEQAISAVLTQFSAQLLHTVHQKQLSPAMASELLARLIAGADLPIPATVFALHQVLQNLAEHKRQQADNEQIKREMGRILPLMPVSHLHQADNCRYTGRYTEPKRSA